MGDIKMKSNYDVDFVLQDLGIIVRLVAAKPTEEFPVTIIVEVEERNITGVTSENHGIIVHLTPALLLLLMDILEIVV